MPETDPPTPQERIERATRVLSMLGRPQVPVDVIELVARVDAYGGLLIARGLVTAEELEERVLVAKAEFFEAVIGTAQTAARARSTVGDGDVARETQ